MADPQALRQLKIKTGVVKRLHKEEGIYEDEVTAAQASVEKLKAAGADGADVRQAERIVADSQQMIPRTRKQLEDALVALQDLVAALAEDKAVAGSQEYQDAVAAVEAASK
ncbi:hypothetical protein CcaverHIS002_0607130 [Cutaneotrichosporon cavernicola]|uniref:Tubulin-specific chaperone A n=1 Tax=Cutaneotrichosporon cavernicola TaxID=279322 RepID=A0AA48L987_9TREE|nr:uncharacterized protein CcaverHIS019_0606550 [Cutaneotrichosporon cavernicola]BEI86426.1 hypothetical protein CcaverHIS002_0607130 [Cutaneotrichosporon cavernicola]BEI94196.1 hypothetical protein CcaverHIS019_0606550 [Cutaneotrichosporon cavernicola]BEJ01976.1 hypothetical protein CcaverHIS631_0606580 [Cutaneotrichosporon cavernicola]BEJ09739.1 hypothetical protein CcaverHIS641_0606540 [Cutaneotrichosporon cavernicola]